ncbi:unnamed protein product [Adineta steineri]|uniref:Uncharacterized protein n=1 Tax=Adineta steineri TaxID=433720 RepID=A0A819H2W3_9BILA|nr:unnamed protein product [Adineta steineri]CAF1428449.1 unnamed protein product [Adineta steineri]CAF3896736.1 unnamed protein product [Adineta steineri]CAF4065464.1 unnamed protein product [Adineta steineri]
MNINHSEDQAVLLYMFRKFQRWIELGQSLQIESTEEQDEIMRRKYCNPFETSPEKNRSTIKCTQSIIEEFKRNLISS